MFGDGKAQACASVHFGAEWLNLVKSLKEFLLVGGRDANSSILNKATHLCWVFRVGFVAKADAALFGELNGVVDEVAEYLPNSSFVGMKKQGFVFFRKQAHQTYRLVFKFFVALVVQLQIV